jgi:hypothetical protein
MTVILEFAFYYMRKGFFKEAVDTLSRSAKSFINNNSNNNNNKLKQQVQRN